MVMLVMSAGIIKAQWVIQPEVGMTAYKRVDGYEDWKSGWKLGAGIEYRFKEWFGLKSGLYYTQRGYSLPPYIILMDRATGMYNMESIPSWGSDNLVGMSWGDTKRHFLQIPLLAKINVPITDDIRLTVAAGPYIGYCIHNSYSYGRANFGYREGGFGGPNHSIIYSPDYSNAYGYGYYNEAGYGYNPYNPFEGVRELDFGVNAEVGVEVKNWAFKLAYEVSLAEEYKNGDNIKPKYHTFTMSIGYNFKIGK